MAGGGADPGAGAPFGPDGRPRRGRAELHAGEGAADFWRGYLWGHFDAVAELVVALAESPVGTPPELLAAVRALKARRERLAAEKGVLSHAQLERVYRLLETDASEETGR